MASKKSNLKKKAAVAGSSAAVGVGIGAAAAAFNAGESDEINTIDQESKDDSAIDDVEIVATKNSVSTGGSIKDQLTSETAAQIVLTQLQMLNNNIQNI